MKLYEFARFFMMTSRYSCIARALWVVLFIFFGACVSTSRAYAAALTQVTATPANVTVLANTEYLIYFKTTTSIPVDGKIVLEFPTGFDVSSASFDSWSGIDGLNSVSVAGQVVTVTRSGDGTSSAAGIKTITLANVINHADVGDEYQVTVTTSNAADSPLDGPTLSLYFQLSASHVETTVDGLYYLRGVNQTHYQYANDVGTIYDIGTLSQSAPVDDEYRHCGSWTQFYFDDTGTFTQTNQIDNIYYHVWWNSTDMQGSLGYDITGEYSVAMNQSITVNHSNSANKVASYRLYAGLQTLLTPADIVGNNIYNFGIKFYRNISSPQLISTPNQLSYIIINVPASVDTVGLSGDGDTDQDDDGLSDNDELYTYYTHPYISDTDHDGSSDQEEVNAGLNPLDYDSAPQVRDMNYSFIGETTGDAMGSSLTTVSDQDGDGLRDVVVGVRNASPGGVSNAGSVYILSSATGELIRQINGTNTFFGLGAAVEHIEDLDGDGKEDLVIGAKYGSDFFGAFELYSSATGTLIREVKGSLIFSNFGSSISVIADQDADGIQDVLVGASDATGGGAAYIYSSASGTLLRQWNSPSASISFGFKVVAITDRDDDGKEDVAISAPYINTSAGSVYIYSSATGALLDQIDGSTPQVAFGLSLTTMEDLDGDGEKELVIGSPIDYSGSEVNTGIISIFSSSTGSVLRSFEGVRNHDALGTSVSTIPDQDGDGIEDLLLGAECSDANGQVCSGEVFIFSSVTGNQLRSVAGIYPNDRLGSGVIATDDLDGDGKADFVAGARGADSGIKTNTGAIYFFSSAVTGIPTQTWMQGTNNPLLYLSHYFFDANSDTLPDPLESITYSLSTQDNPYIDVSVDGSSSAVTLDSPAEWAGTESVIITAEDATGLTATPETLSLVVSGTPFLNTPIIGTPTVLSENAITWTWTDSSEIEQSYSIEYVDNGLGSASNKGTLFVEAARSTSGNVYSWSDNNLKPGTSYSIRVRAYNPLIGESQPSGIATATTKSNTSMCSDQPPGGKPPRIYGALAETTDSIRLYFTPADGPTTSYVLSYGRSPGSQEYGSSNLGVLSKEQMSYVVKDLQPNMTYYFRIRGQNGCAAGGWSDEVKASTKTTAYSSSQSTQEIEDGSSENMMYDDKHSASTASQSALIPMNNDTPPSSLNDLSQTKKDGLLNEGSSSLTKFFTPIVIIVCVLFSLGTIWYFFIRRTHTNTGHSTKL